MIERIKKIMESENMSAGKFADEIGIIGSRLSHYLSGRNNVSLDLVMKILERFRGINPEWLMFGRGEMYKSPDQKSSSPTNAEPDLFNSFTSSSSDGLIENDGEKSDFNDVQSDISDSEPIKTANESSLEDDNSVVNQVNEPLIRASKTQKNIEKILVMYSDSTFDCYSPNGHKV